MEDTYLLQYIKRYKNKTFKESSFNDVDALIFAELSYFPFTYLSESKKVFTVKELNDYLKDYVPSSNAKRKKWDLELLKEVIKSLRYKGIKVAYFTKTKSKESEKQFQAVSFILKDYIYVAYAGTDASIIGWKEDLNLAFLHTIPSEESALTYLRFILNKYKRRKVIVGGHSKGGRLALYASKNLENHKRIYRIYSFDGPGFLDEFYDEKYDIIAKRYRKIIPSESIIGRILSDKDEANIIKSDTKSIFQHDTYSWVIEDNHLVETKSNKEDYRIANIINKYLVKYSDEQKHIVIEAIYDLLIKLNITTFGNKEYNKELAKNAIKELPSAYKELNKEQKDSLKEFLNYILLETAKQFLIKKKK